MYGQTHNQYITKFAGAAAKFSAARPKIIVSILASHANNSSSGTVEANFRSILGSVVRDNNLKVSVRPETNLSLPLSNFYHITFTLDSVSPCSEWTTYFGQQLFSYGWSVNNIDCVTSANTNVTPITPVVPIINNNPSTPVINALQNNVTPQPKVDGFEAWLSKNGIPLTAALAFAVVIGAVVIGGSRK